MGIRSRIDYGTIVKIAYIMGNDYFESLEDLSDPNKIPMGIGIDCYIENAIIDKHVRIGDNVIIRGNEHLQDVEAEHYVIKKAIVVVIFLSYQFHVKFDRASALKLMFYSFLYLPLILIS